MSKHTNWRFDDYYAERLIWFMEGEYYNSSPFSPEWGIGDEFCLEWSNIEYYKSVIRRLVRKGEYTKEQYHKLCKHLDEERRLHKFIESDTPMVPQLVEILQEREKDRISAHNTILEYIKNQGVDFTLFHGGRYGTDTIRVAKDTPDLVDMIENPDMISSLRRSGVISKAHKFIRKRHGGKMFKYYVLWT